MGKRAFGWLRSVRFAVVGIAAVMGAAGVFPAQAGECDPALQALADQIQKVKVERYLRPGSGSPRPAEETPRDLLTPDGTTPVEFEIHVFDRLGHEVALTAADVNNLFTKITYNQALIQQAVGKVAGNVWTTGADGKIIWQGVTTKNTGETDFVVDSAGKCGKSLGAKAEGIRVATLVEHANSPRVARRQTGSLRRLGSAIRQHPVAAGAAGVGVLTIGVLAASGGGSGSGGGDGDGDGGGGQEGVCQPTTRHCFDTKNESGPPCFSESCTTVSAQGCVTRVWTRYWDDGTSGGTVLDCTVPSGCALTFDCSMWTYELRHHCWCEK